MAGIFVFLPLLAKVHVNRLVQKAKWKGSKMIPALSFYLSLLALKLLDKERKSHIADWNFDPGLGFFAGLNVLPKTTATTDYSCRLSSLHHHRMMEQWVSALYPVLCPEGSSCFALDAHAIPYRGDPTLLETHYVPSQAKKTTSILSFFARSAEHSFLCYADADIRKKSRLSFLCTL